MKKLLFAIAMGTVMLFNGANVTTISAKEKNHIVEKQPKEDKTRKEAAERLADMIIDELEKDDEVYITKIEITKMNRKHTKAEFEAEDDEGWIHTGTFKIGKFLGKTTRNITDYTAFH